MKRLVCILLCAAFSVAAADKPQVSRNMMAAMEKSVDQRVSRLWDDNPFVLIGPTRGVYLEGYGAVFTAEVNLVVGPTLLMRPYVTKDEKDRHRQKKIARLPQLKAALLQALADSAASLDTVPSDEQIVIAVFISRYPWEEPDGLPAEVMMQAPKRKLLEAQRNGGANLEASIHLTEY